MTAISITTEPDPPAGLVSFEAASQTLLVPDDFPEWSSAQQRGYLIRRRGDLVSAEQAQLAQDVVDDARAGDDWGDPWQTAELELCAYLQVTPNTAQRIIHTSCHLRERMPETAKLLAAGWIGLAAAHVITEETVDVDPDLFPEIDRRIAEGLLPTRRRRHPPMLGPMRKMVKAKVRRLDPVGASARAQQAKRTEDVTLTSEEDDMAHISVRASVATAHEIMERIDALASAADEDDPRVAGQLRVAGLLSLLRGWNRLPLHDGSLPDDPGAAAAARRVVLNIFESGSGGGQGPTPVFLPGYGELTDATSDDLRRGADVRVRRVADLADPARRGARRPVPSAGLRLFCQGRDGTCVFPNCTRRAERCDLDHIDPFDQQNPDSGGLTTSDELACLCRFHHRAKTRGYWVYYRDTCGTYVWMHGPRHPKRDRSVRVRQQPTGPLAHLGAPQHRSTSRRQRKKAEAGLTGGRGGVCTGERPTFRSERLDDESRRRRRQVLDAQREELHRKRDAEAQARARAWADEEPAPF